ncbi:hypothetical protein, partial [Lacticaseibacillus casei]|uniref:hypothetical protein n=1 Tax=Lacticaseibacillus casei TaxID=1582 RepID=UPI001E4424DA
RISVLDVFYCPKNFETVANLILKCAANKKPPERAGKIEPPYLDCLKFHTPWIETLKKSVDASGLPGA